MNSHRISERTKHSLLLIALCLSVICNFILLIYQMPPEIMWIKKGDWGKRTQIDNQSITNANKLLQSLEGGDALIAPNGDMGIEVLVVFPSWNRNYYNDVKEIIDSVAPAK